MGSCVSKASTVSPVESGARSPSEPQNSTPLAAQGHSETQKSAASSSTQQPSNAASASDDVQQDYAGAPAPICELNRIEYLHDLSILYTAPEQRFDDITKLCTLVFKVPIALVSLVDSPVQWFKSAQGVNVDRTPRNTSFCAWTLLPAYPEALVVEDALKDARFKDNPLVTGPPYIRFYAGCPLVSSNGMRLGSLCIIDDKPREFDANSCNLLANMTEMCLREIEKTTLKEQRLRQQMQTEHRQLLRAIDCFTEAIMLVEVHETDQSWAVVFANEAWEQAVGLQRPRDGSHLPFWDVFQLPPSSCGAGDDWIARECVRAIKSQQNFELLLDAKPTQQGQAGALLQAQFRCAANTGLDSNMLPIGIPNFLPSEQEGPGRTFYFATLREALGAADTPSSTQQQQHHHQPKQQQPGSLQNGSRQGEAAGGQQQLVADAGPSHNAQFMLLTSSNDPMPDIKLGPLLGKGAFGRVYRATWQGRMVAVKIIEYTQEPGQKDLLEGLLSEQVHHPNVVTTYRHATRALEMATDDDLDSTPSQGAISSSSASRDGAASRPPRKQLRETWLLLEFCNRGCISDAVEKGWFTTKPPPSQVDGSVDSSSFTGGLSCPAPDLAAILATAREVAAAMSYLHHRNMLHGDLTGNNVLLTAAPQEKRGFTAKVSDFGLSRLVSADTPIIETRTCGTVTHMPPETLLNGQLSKAMDVYSWGVIMWEMYAAQRPYAGLSHSQVLHAIGMGRLLQLPAGMPQGLKELLAACMSRDPAQRPPFTEVVDRMVQLEVQLEAQGSI